MEDDVLKKFWEVEDYNLNRPVFLLEEKSVVDHFDATHSTNSRGRFIVQLPRKAKLYRLEIRGIRRSTDFADWNNC